MKFKRVFTDNFILYFFFFINTHIDTYLVISFCNVPLFTNIFCRFPAIYIEKTTFVEFEEICKQICKRIRNS